MWEELLFSRATHSPRPGLPICYQEQSRTPLLIAIDGENGLGMRLKNTISYPQQMALGAIS